MGGSLVRDLADTSRYDVLPAIASKMGLATESNNSLWKDQALQVLNMAVIHSFAHADVAMVESYPPLND